MLTVGEDLKTLACLILQKKTDEKSCMYSIFGFCSHESL